MIPIKSFKIDNQSVSYKTIPSNSRTKKVTVLKLLLWGHFKKIIRGIVVKIYFWQVNTKIHLLKKPLWCLFNEYLKTFFGGTFLIHEYLKTYKYIKHSVFQDSKSPPLWAQNHSIQFSPPVHCKTAVTP